MKPTSMDSVPLFTNSSRRWSTPAGNRANGRSLTFSSPAPRFDDAGQVSKPGYVTVLHNGLAVHNHFELQGSTSYVEPPKYSRHGEKEPIRCDFMATQCGSAICGCRRTYSRWWARNRKKTVNDRIGINFKRRFRPREADLAGEGERFGWAIPIAWFTSPIAQVIMRV